MIAEEAFLAPKLFSYLVLLTMSAAILHSMVKYSNQILNVKI